MGGIAMVMLLLGDETALEGLQSLAIITAVPFAVVMLLIIIAWVNDLRTDPYALRYRYQDNELSQAVLEAVDRYAGDLAIQVDRSDPGAGASGRTDSAHDDYTEWYQRTDEYGDPVGYDFATGKWEDGWSPETGKIDISPARSSQDTDKTT